MHLWGNCAWKAVWGKRSASWDWYPEQHQQNIFWTAAAENWQTCLPAPETPESRVPQLGGLCLLLSGRRVHLEPQRKTPPPGRLSGSLAVSPVDFFQLSSGEHTRLDGSDVGPPTP
ncbi:hypothetical protein CHARACLAT_011326 [Characodon lateralis]|uniref:Uncharacterized protein n=1 Tax=Characodon lateralis TaxID=208331 RepID=A0ABU7DU97_9TELE|nr:hypothetical protein [Characodon lateralis]